MIFSQNHKVQIGLAPDADRWTSSPATDIFSMKEYNHITFIVVEGAGGTGTTALTIESCDDNGASNSTAIAFNYAKATTMDTYSDLTAATTTGVEMTAGANKIYVCEVDASALTSRSGVKDQYVRMQTTENDSTAVDAAIIVIQSEPRRMSDSSDMPGALT